MSEEATPAIPDGTRMESLALHLIRPIVQHPDDLAIQVIEGDASLMLELVANAEDKERIEGDNGRTLRSVRNILSAAAGRQRASLDLVEVHSSPIEEE